jgi:hypothetical protein
VGTATWSDFVRNTAASWRLWGLSRSYKCRPSELLGIENSWDAYCFDNAIQLFGGTIQNKIDSVSEKTDAATSRKRESILRRYIPELAKARKFADPGKR